ncbi:MAG TPA: type II toxin-antitoxin system VapB family antitoxin [Caulobacter sp.]|nr:type II toxin-antitoxin system VapB family antitoxin [Caulobacter sp.]
MGLSIKRMETEQLARQVASATGVSLTDAIHNALSEKLVALGLTPETPAQRLADIQAWLREVDARPRFSNQTLAEIEAEMYDENGDLR